MEYKHRIDEIIAKANKRPYFLSACRKANRPTEVGLYTPNSRIRVTHLGKYSKLSGQGFIAYSKSLYGHPRPRRRNFGAPSLMLGETNTLFAVDLLTKYHIRIPFDPNRHECKQKQGLIYTARGNDTQKKL